MTFRKSLLLGLLAGAMPAPLAAQEASEQPVLTDEEADEALYDEGEGEDLGNVHGGQPLTEAAEGVGFEPTRRLTSPNGFQGRRIQPLCHPSEALRGMLEVGMRAWAAPH